MSWLSSLRALFAAPERPVDLRGVPGTRDPHTLPDPPPVVTDQAPVLIEEPGGVLRWATTRTHPGQPPLHMILIDGDDRPYHHVREHDGTWVYQRM